jgi:hypothetical protein
MHGQCRSIAPPARCQAIVKEERAEDGGHPPSLKLRRTGSPSLKLPPSSTAAAKAMAVRGLRQDKTEDREGGGQRQKVSGFRCQR